MATKPGGAVKIVKGKIFHTGWGYKKQTQSVKNFTLFSVLTASLRLSTGDIGGRMSRLVLKLASI